MVGPPVPRHYITGWRTCQPCGVMWQRDLLCWNCGHPGEAAESSPSFQAGTYYASQALHPSLADGWRTC